MATVVNNPPANSDGNGGGFLLGVIVLIIFVILFVFYGLPMLRGTGGGATQAPQVNIPDKVDVNVNQQP